MPTYFIAKKESEVKNVMKNIVLKLWAVIMLIFAFFFPRYARTAEFRAKMKELAEQRADLQEAMQALLDAAKAETRAMNAEEQTKFTDLENQIKAIDATIAAEERAAALANTKKENKADKTAEERATAERQAFEIYIKRACGVAVEQIGRASCRETV